MESFTAQDFTAKLMTAASCGTDGKPIDRHDKAVYSQGFSNPGIILFQQQNLMNTPFTCSIIGGIKSL
jgi:hypothetical protein